MSRSWIAAPAGLLGFCLYIALAMLLGEALVTAHWAVQAVFYLLAGVVWALPARWLMFWAAGLR
jgi:hypothetical protein